MTIGSLRPGNVLNHRTMAQGATEELRRRILDGELRSGEQLRQAALAEELGISRIPLREALVQLEAEGLVRINAHRGAVVSELTSEEIDELFDLRAAIEPMLLKRSAPKLSREDFARIRALLDEYDRELDDANVRRWGELNAEFHRLLYQHADRPRSMSLVVNLLQECDRHTRVQLSMTGARSRAEEEHREILRLCEERQFTAAARLLTSHILHVSASLNALARAK
ncbi:MULTISPECIES: GntR family transcriptional regulator [unclassified Chelatococcus]|uniref:GntR family transcriptional regulator n=1 Tax=unclassified Chelatococcus TaxID=2638111 RepID=UPI001BCE441D|nr:MULTISPECIES: GntR family transcriptional regulator [unclassified Chelatococcus]MBS7695972.1 GntR family transcriptional regulator [Chelatococcus sp. YT9]MBX3555653.1 GntR family transcriptional regulator [Chelatococcus sp.]